MPEDNRIHHEAAFLALGRADHEITEAADALARCRECSNACPVLKAISLLIDAKRAAIRPARTTAPVLPAPSSPS